MSDDEPMMNQLSEPKRKEEQTKTKGEESK